MIRKLVLGASFLLLVLLLLSCSKKETKSLSALEAQGKASYMSNCITCHHQDPRLTGSVGPEIADSSLELLTARVLSKTYPPGYKPKRTSELMPALPFLKRDIQALHAYINSFAKK